MLLISFIFIYVQFNVDIVVKIVHIIVIMLRASGKIGIANCVLPSLNKDITYLLTYLLTYLQPQDKDEFEIPRDSTMDCGVTCP